MYETFDIGDKLSVVSWEKKRLPERKKESETERKAKRKDERNDFYEKDRFYVLLMSEFFLTDMISCVAI